MAIDKSWMTINNRQDRMYVEGVESFLKYAYRFKLLNDVIQCPCKKCRNVVYNDESTIRFHLLNFGIMTTYTTWYVHGETSTEELSTNEDLDDNDSDFGDDMVGLVNRVYGVDDDVPIDNDVDFDGTPSEPKGDAAEFYRLLNEAKEKLHSGCEMSKLAIIVKLLHMKSFHRWTNKSFDDLLGLLREVIPNGKHNLPESYSSAKKYIRRLGLHYEKYDVCENHCTLYWGPFANATSCQICGLSRWKSGDTSNDNKKIPHKVLRYFPLKPRLQRLFMSNEMASNMRWHAEQRVEDDTMSHPADTPAWKSFDDEHENFASDPRNVRMGLATDGFQPFGNMSSQHSIWPVILIPYNLPPWLCMKQSNLIVSMIIPGPHSPGMGIDVFLQPLIAELKELWYDGVETYDAHSKQNFSLRAAIIWTINDFPAYADLSGWSTKGYKACPNCHKHTRAVYLPASKKLSYAGHRVFLPCNHKWRKDTKSFNGLTEKGTRPTPLSGDDVLKEFETFTPLPFNRGVKRKYDSANSFENWRKKSIFFELPYWRTLLMRHNLDVMDIEKNVCDNVLGTLMNIKGKTKDTLNSRKDLVSMGIRHELHPTEVGDKLRIPLARYVLSDNDKLALCKMLVLALTRSESPRGG
ncbi:hypothetical protein M5689_021385 [Euphorbia peplus]|nr:hypothetical protein M5689_021385 [Euphorbia peplus]